MSEDKLSKLRRSGYLTLDDAAMLHGHKGPFLVIGYRIGEYIVQLTKPKDEFGLSAKVYIPFERPYSCMLDGLQCSTKCTLGKKSIECIDSNEMKIVFECKETNKKIYVWIKKSIIDEALKCEDTKAFVQKLEKMPTEEYIEKMITE